MSLLSLKKYLPTMFLRELSLICFLKRNQNIRYISVSRLHKKRFRHIDDVIPKNALEGLQNGMLQTEKGKIYDSKPFKLLLKKDKIYAWCLCGHSKSQPLCDCTHKILELNIKLRPIFFKVNETKEYWLCNCKQTEHRPFCDGSHIAVQEDELKQKKEQKARQTEES